MADHLFGITDTGKVRKNNEDVFIAEELMNGQFILAGVIDGVGGYEGGEVAAAVTKEVVLSELEVVGREITTQLNLAFNLANEEIIGRKLLDKQLADMACVATIAVVDKLNNMLYYIHVGDTRLYLFRDKSLIKISHDQSFVGFLEESGRLTEQEAMKHPKRNEINQALGLGSREEMTASYFETGSSPFLPADLILLCSDGLTDLVNSEAISAVLSTDGTLKAKAAKLVALANGAGGKDNITVVLALNDKLPVQHEVARPADLKSEISETQGTAVKPSGAIQSAAPVIRSEEGKSQAEVNPPKHHGSVSSINIRPVTPEQNSLPDNGKVQVNKFLLIFLTVFSILFVIASIWLSISYYNNRPKPEVIAAAPPVNLPEKQLQDSLARLKGDTLFLSAKVFKSPIRLTHALIINRDTLVIKQEGNVVLLRDSAYTGPALFLSPECKHIVADQLVIQGFETGIVSEQNALEMKNVRFIQCKNPIQVFFGFPDGYFVNGRLNKRNYQADSLAKK